VALAGPCALRAGSTCASLCDCGILRCWFGCQLAWATSCEWSSNWGAACKEERHLCAVYRFVHNLLTEQQQLDKAAIINNHPQQSVACLNLDLSVALGKNRTPGAGDIEHANFSLLSRQIYAVPDLCCIVSRRLVELVGGVFDLWLSSAIAVFEQDGCVDWLRTATVYTKQTTGCPWWLRSLWYPYPSLHVLSLASACK